MLDKTSGISVAVALTGRGMMGVVELSAKAVPVENASVDVVAKRGKGLVGAVEISVALLASD